MLTTDELKRIQDIVGPQWVNAHPCMTDTYSIHRHSEWVTGGKSPWLPRAEAVVMPASALEIAAIIRLCNQTRLMVKPISTGWGPQNAPTREGVVLLDLKRMDKIIDIDVKNQVAVVEPYVKAIRLQAALWKEGLNVNVVSCGGNHSVLASTTSGWGYGLSGPGLGYSGRNFLGAEWVSPTGEILTLGSAGNGAGWFSAEGPGPSMRGIVRGQWGAFGSLGVFTKAAAKLYKWDGPAQPEIEGANPHYYLKNPLPENIGFFVLSVQNEQGLADLGYKLGEAEIQFCDFRLPAFHQALVAAGNNWGDVEEIWNTGFFQKMSKYAMVLGVMGHSQREYDWKVSAIHEILKEVKGVSLPIGQKLSLEKLRSLQPLIKHIDNPLKIASLLQGLLGKVSGPAEDKLKTISELYHLLVRHATNTQSAFPLPNSFFTLLGSFDTWDKGITESRWAVEGKGKYIENGGLVNDGGDAGVGGTYENGHMGYFEPLGLYTTNSRKSAKAFVDLGRDSIKASIDRNFGISFHGYGTRMNNAYGPHCGNFHEWMIKIKKTLDPKTASDPYLYHDPDSQDSALGH